LKIYFAENQKPGFSINNHQGRHYYQFLEKNFYLSLIEIALKQV